MKQSGVATHSNAMAQEKIFYQLQQVFNKGK